MVRKCAILHEWENSALAAGALPVRASEFHDRAQGSSRPSDHDGPMRAAHPIAFAPDARSFERRTVMKTAPVPPPGTRGQHGATAKPRLPRHPSTLWPLADGQADPDRPFEEGVRDSIDADLRHRLISEAAFDLYVKRGYADGYDLEDWLDAEERIDHMLLNPQADPSTDRN
jgi:hypothetical protein